MERSKPRDGSYNFPMTSNGGSVPPTHTTIAVIGAGISGLSAAWLLSRRCKVVLFEREARPGGHSHTVDAVRRRGTTAVDTGFIVYNTASYPNLVALFDHLGVTTARSDMSFAVSLGDGAYEYSGTGLRGMFGQASNADSGASRTLIPVHRGQWSGDRGQVLTRVQA